mmetsp:Transcript_112582/g.305655  ORF Transcript_112582/g.305655 Transcript_112582/m.305655 type:complete len:338 (+) Transcript_112582:626-1639(+)
MTTAPAPSPKSTQVVRSSQSRWRERASAPMTTAVFTVPVLIYCAAVTSAKTNPEQAAVRSKATACWQPSSAAVAGAMPNRSSGVEVATSTSPTSSGDTFAFSIARRPASAAIVTSDSSGRMMWRRLIPVRWKIHSSLVSMTSERSSLVTTLEGAADPVPAMAMPATAPMSAADAPWAFVARILAPPAGVPPGRRMRRAAHRTPSAPAAPTPKAQAGDGDAASAGAAASGSGASGAESRGQKRRADDAAPAEEPSAAGGEDDVDPLDAFMAGVQDQAADDLANTGKRFAAALEENSGRAEAQAGMTKGQLALDNRRRMWRNKDKRMKELGIQNFQTYD